MIALIWKSARLYKWYILLSLQAPLIGAAFIPLNQYAIKLTIDILAENPVFLIEDLLFPMLLFIGGHITLEILWRISDIAEYKSLPFIKTSIIHNSYSYITGHSYQFFQNNLSGMISAKINNIEAGATKIYNNFKLNIVHPISMILITMVFLYFVSPVFVPVMLSFYLVFFPTVYFLSKKISRFSSTYTGYKQEISGSIVDSISNIMSVLLFANRQYEKKSIEQDLDALVSNEKIMLKHEFILHAFIGVIYVAVSVIIVFLLIDLRQKGKITIGDFALVLGVLSHMLEVAYILVMRIKDLVKDIGELKESFSIFNKEFEIYEKPDAKTLVIQNPKIEFQYVVFGYNNTKIFKNLSFVISVGEKVGVVGASGAGKSTLVSLLLRCFEINSGQILIDNHNLSDVTRDSLRSQITVIPQDTSLFHRSIKDNIRYGKLDSTDEEIIEASKKSYIHSFINDLPEGYDTIVGERGMKLSGGQRQRISIARAILKDSPVLILDEATSSLDSEAEKYIQESLNLLIADKNKTVVAIAHRLSTLKHMDRIIVLDSGQIVEEGTHEELIVNNGSLYKKLWKLQEI